MIKEIKIENFKSIESLNLELGRLNVFIGANGSGKSNILEGIAFGSAAAGNKLENLFLSARGIRITEPNLMQSAFKKDKKPTSFRFTDSDLKSLTYTVSFKDGVWRSGPLVGEESSILMENEFAKNMWFGNDGFFHYGKEKYSVEEKLPDDIVSKYHQMQAFFSTRIPNFLFASNLADYMIFAPENNFLRNFHDEAQINPLWIRGEGLFSHLVYIFKEKPDLFKKINEHLQLLDWFDSFEIPNDLMFTERRIKIKDRYLEEGLQYFDQRSANEGFLYLLFYLTLFISDETPKFFAIDNIDNAMNPKMGDELVHLLAKLAKDHDKQVILTTHNPSVLDGLDLSDDDQRLFVISRNKKGHTQALRVPHRESEERLSYRFIRGSIGGLPKNF